MQIFLIIAVIVALDQATKFFAKIHLGEGVQQITLISDWLKFTYTENSGIAFGIDLGGRAVVTTLSILATIGICYYLYRTQRDNGYYRAAFGCIIGGAFGNLIDRIVHGQVIDFIHFDLYNGYVWGKYVSVFPIFNVADTAITVGVLIMFVFYKHIFEDPVPETLAADSAPAVEPPAEPSSDAPSEPAKQPN